MNIRIEALYTKLFFRDRAYLTLLACCLLSHALIWALLIWQFNVLYQPGRDFIPLHYKVLFGIDFYSFWYYIFFVPGLGLVCSIVNIILSRMAYHYLRTISYLLLAAGFALQLLLTYALYLIIQVNIF